MVINNINQRHVNRRMYTGTGALVSVTLLKRGDDQRQGTVTSYTLHECRASAVHKSGNPIQGPMAAHSRVVWHIPMVELERVGVNYLNALDRIVDPTGKYWQPEATNEITFKLILTHYCLECREVDPPAGTNA